MGFKKITEARECTECSGFFANCDGEVVLYPYDELNKPYIIDETSYSYGDDALKAIKEGRQILIRVQNTGTGSDGFVNYMPVLQYQLPTKGREYLYLIYLRDGIATNIAVALSTGDFSVVYGQITMLLSQPYDTDPLE